MKATIERVQIPDTQIIIRDISLKTVVETGIRIANQAKALSPWLTGQLRNSISVATKDQTGIRLNTEGGKLAPPLDQSGLREMEAYVGSNVEHAVYKEYGTKNKDGSKRMQADPFLRPAVEVVTGREPAQIMKEINNRTWDSKGI